MSHKSQGVHQEEGGTMPEACGLHWQGVYLLQVGQDGWNTPACSQQAT